MKALSPHQQWEDFIHQGLPGRQDEAWKYTDLSFLSQAQFTLETATDSNSLVNRVNQYRLPHDECILLVLVDGKFISTLSDIEKLPAQVVVDTLKNTVSQHDAVIKQQIFNNDIKKYPFAHMNSLMAEDGLYVSIPPNCELTLPIHVLSLAVSDEKFMAHPHRLFVFGEKSKVTLLEEHVALTNKPYLINVVTNLIVGKSASLRHYKIQRENELAVHMAHTFVTQKQDSSTAFISFSSGANFARDEIVVALNEPGANCEAAGFYRLQHDNQYIDHHINVIHNAPHSSSEMLYKGTLDAKSRAVFNGRVYVKENAQKILSFQANHNLLLSPQAEIYSKPELEIYADDVKCKHGATTGQLDPDALFYMRARGINRNDAVAILLQGFAEDIIQRVTHLGMRQRVEESIL